MATSRATLCSCASPSLSPRLSSLPQLTTALMASSPAHTFTSTCTTTTAAHTRQPRASSPRQFGGIVVFSNALTAGPGRDSPRVGTAQGHGVRVAERGTVTDLSMHLVMHDGSGSVDVKGRIDMEAKVRESTVVGGAGRFRLARGYVLTRNYGYYELGKGGTVEMDVYLMP